MQRIILLPLLLLTLILPSVAQTGNRRTFRVQTKANKVKSTAPEAFGLTVEKYVSTHDVDSDGTATHVWEMQRRCANAVCLPTASGFAHLFNGDLQKVEVLEANIVAVDGKRTALKSESIRIKPTAQAEAAPGFSSLNEVEIDFDGLKLGEASQLKIKISTTKATFEDHFDAMELFPLLFNWKSIEINLSAPADYPLYTEAPGLEGGRIADANGRRRWQWRKQNLAAFAFEPAMFDVVSVSPRFAVTSFKDHDELGRAFWENVKTKAIITPDLKKLADEITKDIADQKQQANAIYNWVNRNIRYLLVVLDRGGWNPHSTTEILANRYGDCKDYTTLIYALLKAKGIESSPVLIRSDSGDWFPQVAAPDYFNHAVLYIPSLKLIADATAPNTRLGLIPQTLVGKKALLSGETTGVFEIPKDNPDDSQILTEVGISVLDNGDLKTSSRNTYKGRTEIVFRPLFGNAAISKNPEIFVTAMLAYFGVQGTGRIKKIGDPFEVGEPFTVEVETEIPGFTAFTQRGRFSLPIGINFTNTLELEQFVGSEERKTNLILGAARVSEKFIVSLPNFVTVETLPPAVNFENAVGSYKNEFTLVGNKVHIFRELVMSKDVITPKDYPLTKELIKKAVDGHNSEFAFKTDLVALRAKIKDLKPVKVKPVVIETVSATLKSGYSQKQLSSSEIARLEAKVRISPDDLTARRSLLRHYASYKTRETAKSLASHLSHRLWFVRKHPEMDRTAVYESAAKGDSFYTDNFNILKAEWLKQVSADEKNAAVRLNAAEFLRSDDTESAIKLLIDGAALHSRNYEFPLRLSELNYAGFERLEKGASPEKRQEYLQKSLDSGETALILIKAERSQERDDARNGLLKRMCRVAIEMDHLDRAKAFAMELILEFGQSSWSPEFDTSTHIGNITLGLVALRTGDTAKAKEHLLIAVRAPLRQTSNYLLEIDTQLARELFAKGEKDVVLEYFKLCEELAHLKAYPDLYEDEIKGLKLWQDQIKQGKTPSFDFGAADMTER